MAATLALEPDMPHGLPHATLSNDRVLQALMQPLLVQRDAGSGGSVVVSGPELERLLRAALTTGQPICSLQRFVQMVLMLRVQRHQLSPGFQQSCIKSLQLSLDSPPAAAALQAQLAAVQAHEAAAGSAWRVLAPAKLRASVALLVSDMLTRSTASEGPSAALHDSRVAAAWAFAEADATSPRAWVRTLCMPAPDAPALHARMQTQASCVCLANNGYALALPAAQDHYGCATTQRWLFSGSGVAEQEAAIQPWRRGLEVARAAGCDVWTARLALQIAELGLPVQ